MTGLTTCSSQPASSITHSKHTHSKPPIGSMEVLTSLAPRFEPQVVPTSFCSQLTAGLRGSDLLAHTQRGKVPALEPVSQFQSDCRLSRAQRGSDHTVQELRLQKGPQLPAVSTSYGPRSTPGQGDSDLLAHIHHEHVPDMESSPQPQRDFQTISAQRDSDRNKHMIEVHGLGPVFIPHVASKRINKRNNNVSLVATATKFKTYGTSATTKLKGTRALKHDESRPPLLLEANFAREQPLQVEPEASQLLSMQASRAKGDPDHTAHKEQSAALGDPGDSKYTEGKEISARINKDHHNIALLAITTELKTTGTPALTKPQGSWALMKDKFSSGTPDSGQGGPDPLDHASENSVRRLRVGNSRPRLILSHTEQIQLLQNLGDTEAPTFVAPQLIQEAPLLPQFAWFGPRSSTP